MKLFIFEIITHLRSLIADGKIDTNENVDDFTIGLNFSKDHRNHKFEINFQIVVLYMA